jgi:uncharacterized Ntn-hydrolase superfamily protein
MIISPQELATTYSIVAYDADTNQIGVAVQSHYFSVGSVVPWLEPGVGAIATQSLVNVSYGPIGLAMLRAGLTPEQTLAGLLAGDPDAERRQVAVLGAQGSVATHTGSRCIPAAGHHQGETYSVQANLMEKDTVWGAMAEAYEKADGDLAQRMLAALEAAEAEGGDIRGKQSAALVVMENRLTSAPWQNRIFDLRVDDSPQPLPELRRLLNVARAYRQAGIAYAIIEDETRGPDRYDQALQIFEAAPQLMPDNPEQLFWFAVNLINTGFVEEAVPRFREVFQAQPMWRQLPPRLVPAGLLPDDPALLKRIIEA